MYIYIYNYNYNWTPSDFKELVFLNCWKAWNFQSTNQWPMAFSSNRIRWTTKARWRPLLSVAAAMVRCFTSLPVKHSIFQVYVTGGAVSFGGEGGGWKEVLGHSALQKWNTLNHYPILQRSTSTYYESQSLHHIFLSDKITCLFYFQVNIQKLRGCILCVILCVLYTSYFGVLLPTPWWCDPSESQEVVLEPSLEMNLRGRTWDLRFE